MRVRSFVLAAVLTGVGGAAFAHHSQTMFDETRTVTLQGTVTKFSWINPHVKIHFDVARNGKKTNYEIETNAAASLSRAGWKRDQFKPGDTVTVSFNPVRNGLPKGMLRKIVAADGKEMALPGNTVPPGYTGQAIKPPTTPTKR